MPVGQQAEPDAFFLERAQDPRPVLHRKEHEDAAGGRARGPSGAGARPRRLIEHPDQREQREEAQVAGDDAVHVLRAELQHAGQAVQDLLERGRPGAHRPLLPCPGHGQEPSRRGKATVVVVLGGAFRRRHLHLRLTRLAQRFLGLLVPGRGEVLLNLLELAPLNAEHLGLRLLDLQRPPGLGRGGHGLVPLLGVLALRLRNRLCFQGGFGGGALGSSPAALEGALLLTTERALHLGIEPFGLLPGLSTLVAKPVNHLELAFHLLTQGEEVLPVVQVQGQEVRGPMLHGRGGMLNLLDLVIDLVELLLGLQDHLTIHMDLLLKLLGHRRQLGRIDDRKLGQADRGHQEHHEAQEQTAPHGYSLPVFGMGSSRPCGFVGSLLRSKGSDAAGGSIGSTTGAGGGDCSTWTCVTCWEIRTLAMLMTAAPTAAAQTVTS